MICPFCKSGKPLRTVKTIQHPSSVLRYHKCQTCGRRMRSIQNLDIKIDPRSKASVLSRTTVISL